MRADVHRLRGALPHAEEGHLVRRSAGDSRPRGEKVTVKQPRVDPELCIGCGICTNKCVIKGQPAVLVSSVGESRNPENGVLLSNDPYGG